MYNTEANVEARSSLCNPFRENSRSLATHSTKTETTRSPEEKSISFADRLPVGRSTKCSPDNLHSSSTEGSPARRSRRVPFWMEDNVSGGEFTEEVQQNLLLFTSLPDPVTFKK